MIIYHYTKTIKYKKMRLEGTFGLASYGKGSLVRIFAQYSANFVRSSTGFLLPLHHYAPMTPHFASGMSGAVQAQPAQMLSPYIAPIYEIMGQQQALLRDQQRQHHEHNSQIFSEQSSLMKDMFYSMENSFKMMMEAMLNMTAQHIQNAVKAEPEMPIFSAPARRGRNLHPHIVPGAANANNGAIQVGIDPQTGRIARVSGE